MNDRPYFRLGIDEVEALFQRTRDLEVLKKIRDELHCRTTNRALNLLRKVDEIIAIKLHEGSPQNLQAERSKSGPLDSSGSLKSESQNRPVSGDSITLPDETSSRVDRGRTPNARAAESVSKSDSTSPGLPTENHSRLLDLLTYLEHLAKLGEKPTFSVKEYQQLIFSEAELKGQVGIIHDIASDDGPVWLKIERLQRRDPPIPPKEIQDWIIVSRSPNDEPRIQDSLTRTITVAEADELVRLGTLSGADVVQSLKSSNGSQMVDAILRFEDQPSVKAATKIYLYSTWAEWAETERPRRMAIAVYDKFFSLYQSLQSEGVERPQEIVWGVGVVRWKCRTHEFDHPLIEQMVEIAVDVESGLITVGPRSSAPQIAAKPYSSLEIHGIDAVVSFSKRFFESVPVDIEFSPFLRSTFEPVLRFAATHLDSSGRYHPDEIKDINDRSLPSITETLAITDTWAIYARPRSASFFIEDLERLGKAVANSSDLPGPSRKLVETPSSETDYSPRLVDITKASLGGSVGDFGSIKQTQEPALSDLEFFFPKPFNSDQVAIIQRLEEADGVVVQGPPGTGKTHTIANIICHCLATGRRVLVSSKGEAALTEVRAHIPEGIRDLTISLLTNEREGLKQLEKAVGVLASSATQSTTASLERQILSGQREILDLKKRLVSIDAELASFAQKHLKRVTHENSADGLLPIELAQLICTDADRHKWLTDALSLDPSHDPQFTDDEISTLRKARIQLGDDLSYVRAKLPSLQDFPDGIQVMTLHEEILKYRRTDLQLQSGKFIRFLPSAINESERARALSNSIQQVLSVWQSTEGFPWLEALVERWFHEGLETEKAQLFDSLLPGLSEVRKKRTEMLGFAVYCADDLIGDAQLLVAVGRSAKGERPFGLLPFGKTQVRERHSSLRVENRIPNSREDWYKIERYLTWRSKLSSVIARWNAASVEYGLPPITDHGEKTARWLSEILDRIDKAKLAARVNAPLIRKDLSVFFPREIEADTVVGDRKVCRQILDSIEANLSVHQFSLSRDRLMVIAQALNDCSGSIVVSLQRFLSESVGNTEFTAQELSDEWQRLCREVDRIQNLKPLLETVSRTAGLIHQSGAPKWAETVLTSQTDNGDDKTPLHWRESWSWVRYRNYLHTIDGKERFRQLSAERRRAETEIQKAFSEVVRLRTYLGLKRNMSNQVEAALNMFMAALRHIGKGTGIRAKRFRRDARDAMEKSYSAVPCWIMPTWRISESLPSSLGSFDVVIIDEASQSDITALPALLRGKKILVVGDDKQVSPTAAFVEEKKLLQLKHNYLKHQPFGPLMLPGFSLYELALACLPGKRIMLREHFRCVEPIIRFSFQFYEEPIIPVRLAKPSERLNPPLIDVFVANGKKDKRQINVAEAVAIVDEIEKLIKDPAFAQRTIGVVSLLAAKQAHYIQSKLLERIGEEEYLKHNITCGDAPTFQGKERDIMFVSMVECPETCSTKTALLFQQRFNVALSRARDRMYLFHSVTEQMLKPDDLKARVLQHFKNPMPTTAGTPDAVLEQCDSDFERDVLKRLLELGYRVKPQVKVGPFSIDMVVEGEDDRRLAIELDGDKYHTPERWADDLGRQRIMERVGWRFWRCWGSSFLLDPKGCFTDLLSTLNELEIRPFASSSESSVHTEFRVFAHSPSIEGRNVLAVTNEVAADVGDRVLVTFNDEPGRNRTMLISGDEKSDPLAGVFSKNDSFGKALIGAMVEDQISVIFSGKPRTVTVLGIEKPVAVQLG